MLCCRVRRGDESDDEEGPRHAAKREQNYRSASPAEGRDQAAAAGGDVNGVKDQAGSRPASPAHEQAEVKQEQKEDNNLHGDMQAATLATSEALQGGSKPNSKPNTPSHTPAGRSASPAAEAAPMDVDEQQQAAPQPQQATQQAGEQSEPAGVVKQESPVDVQPTAAASVDGDAPVQPQVPATDATAAAAADGNTPTDAPVAAAAAAVPAELAAAPTATTDDPMQQD